MDMGTCRERKIWVLSNLFQPGMFRDPASIFATSSLLPKSCIPLSIEKTNYPIFGVQDSNLEGIFYLYRRFIPSYGSWPATKKNH